MSENQKPDWRIYYANGYTFDSNMGEPDKAPPFGFICAVGYDETDDRYIMVGWDHYRYDRPSNQFWGMDWFGLLTEIEQRREVYAYFRGETATKAVFRDLNMKAHKDPDFPYGKKKHER